MLPCQFLPVAGLLQLNPEPDHLHRLQPGVQAGLQEAAVRPPQQRQLQAAPPPVTWIAVLEAWEQFILSPF